MLEAISDGGGAIEPLRGTCESSDAVEDHIGQIEELEKHQASVREMLLEQEHQSMIIELFIDTEIKLREIQYPEKIEALAGHQERISAMPRQQASEGTNNIRQFLDQF